MARTELLAHGQAIAIDPLATELASLNVSSHAYLRITTANSAFSPAPVTVSIVHEMFPNTPQANGIDQLDEYRLNPGDNVSRSYDVPGTDLLLTAFPDNQTADATLFFTIFRRS
jgi:hypothetical protein